MSATILVYSKLVDPTYSWPTSVLVSAIATLSLATAEGCAGGRSEGVSGGERVRGLDGG